MKIGYARVSTTEQDLSGQLAALKEAGCKRVYSEKNHGLRFEGILKIDLQGNRPPKAKNRQIRLLERAQSSSPFNSFRILHGRLSRLVVFDQVIEYRPLPLVAHRVNSRQRSTSVSFGVKRTLTEPRLQKAGL